MTKVKVSNENDKQYIINDNNDLYELDLTDVIKDTTNTLWLVIGGNDEPCLVALNDGIFTITSYENADVWVSFPAVEVDIEINIYVKN